MTTQTAIAAQSFGTSTNVGNSKFSITPLTLAAGTMSVVVTAQWTNGAGIVDANQSIRVWFATTPQTVTAANAPSQLGGTAAYVDVRPNPITAGVAIRASIRVPAAGVNFHCWADAPTLTTAATLAVVVAELTS